MKFKRFLFFFLAGLLSACSGNETSNDQQCNDDDASSEREGSTETSDGNDAATDSDSHSETEQPSETDEQTDGDTGEWDGPLSEDAFNVLLTTGMFVEEGEVFTTSYNEGYNLHFAISKEQAASLLPEGMTPAAIKLLESDKKPGYYVSWYLAVMNQDVQSVDVTRVDVFTYARTSTGALTMYFVSSYMNIPESFRNNEKFMEIYEEILEFFARDSKTGEPAYPHYYTEVLSADHDTFKLVYGDASIEMTACDPVTTGERFSGDFVAVNSQIYRTAVDKNVNYFNQDFILAPVETRNLDCVTMKNLTDLNPLFANLAAVQFYGSKDKEITWFYQMCENEVCKNPFE